MPQIGLATFAEDPKLYSDDKPLPQAFARHGHESIFVHEDAAEHFVSTITGAIR